VSARLLYRKIDQYLLNLMFGAEKGITAPITEMASATKTVRIVRAATSVRAAPEDPRSGAVGGMP
jgi:hypothetical protein